MDKNEGAIMQVLYLFAEEGVEGLNGKYVFR